MNKEILMTRLRNCSEIESHKYDGSYELVEIAVSLYENVDIKTIDYLDLELLFMLTIGTWKSSYDHKKEKVKESHLRQDDKEILINLIDEVKLKTEDGKYNSIMAEENETGMFGLAFFTFKRSGKEPGKEKIQKLIDILININKAKSEEKSLSILEENLPSNIYNLKASSLSQILHCLKPNVFPLFNSVSLELYDDLEIELDKPKELSKLVGNIRRIKKFRDENFDFKNYRVIDQLTIKYNYLADPFKTIFNDYPIAVQAMNFIKSVCEHLDINDPDNPIYSFTLREHTSVRKGIHFNYTNALILGFYGEINSDEKMARIALLKDEAEDFCLGGYNEDDLFNHFKEEEVVLCYVSFDELINQDSELHKAYFKTLDFIKDYNSSYNSTPYRNYHIEEIANAVFKPDTRDEIFSTGIDDEIIDPVNNFEPVIDFNIKLELNNLHFPEAEKSRLINQIRINLKQGKHIILTGPPGTGKSKLAKEICKQYVGDKYFKMVTATSDWSTFDTIGGYRPDKDNQLYFSSGIFLDCFKSEDQKQANNWLIIDEINRADIDKAFGPLFSALTGDSIKLSFKDSQGKSIEIIPEEESGENINSHQYIIPENWRIIATMNTFDKTSLYEMSYAFMRRFAFIPVVIPDKINDDLLKEYLDCWDIDDYSLVNQLSQLWKVINETRPIGPAIVEDIYQFLLEQNGDPGTEKSQPDYTSAIINYVLPQFEGLPQEELNKFFYNRLEELDFINDLDVIQRFADDYFHLGGS